MFSISKLIRQTTTQRSKEKLVFKFTQGQWEEGRERERERQRERETRERDRQTDR